MYLFHAWKESFKLFMSANFKLFFLVYLKTVISTYKSYIKYGWPFISVATISAIMYSYFGDYSHSIIRSAIMSGDMFNYYYLAAIVCVSFTYLVQFLYCSFLSVLFARPSVGKKNCAYMRSYSSTFFVSVILMSSLFSILFMFVQIVLLVWWRFTGVNISNMLSYVNTGTYFLKVIFFPLWILFFIDFGGGIVTFFSSLWYTTKMILYNVPFMSVFFAFVVGIRYVFAPYMYYIEPFIHLFFPLWICLLTVYYTKKVYDQARLYQGV